eukprot:2730872-Ditylum_brightwellii.AAC.1
MFVAANIDTSGLHYAEDESVMVMLDYVARMNEKSGCVANENFYDSYVNQTYVSLDERQCWIPLVAID